MKFLIVLATLATASLFTGCSTYPSGSFVSWSHEGNYGVVVTHYTAQGAVKDPVTGNVTIQHYNGSVKYLGIIGPTDTVEGLVLDAAPKK